MVEDEVAVLDHHSPFEIRALFGGDEYWSDYTVEAEVRLIACVIDRMDICEVGVVARAVSKSCFYLFAAVLTFYYSSEGTENTKNRGTGSSSRSPLIS